MQTAQKIYLSDNSKIAIVDFFSGDILANDDSELTKEYYFKNWHKAVTSLKKEPKTLGKSTFMLWCYQNIKVTTKNIKEPWPLRPHGFEHVKGRPHVCVGGSGRNLGYIPLSDAIIHIPDPRLLYARLGIR